MLHVSDNNYTMNALIMAAAGVLEEEDVALMRSVDTSETIISARTHRKVLGRIRRYGKERSTSNLYVYCRRVVAALLVACTILFALCMSVEAVRDEIWNTIITWYEKFVEIHFEPDAAPLAVIETYREPTILPEDLEKRVVTKSERSYWVHYTNGDTIVISYKQSPVSDGKTLQQDAEDCSISTVDIHHSSAQLFQYNDGTISVFWVDDEYIYILSTYEGDIGLDELLQIAESIK